MGWTWSRWGGGHCVKKGCQGKLGQGRSRVVRLWADARVSILSYFPCLSDVFFSPGEPRRQEGVISLLPDTSFIFFCPFWTRNGAILLEMDMVPPGDC